jgi:hypothetical protein
MLSKQVGYHPFIAVKQQFTLNIQGQLRADKGRMHWLNVEVGVSFGRNKKKTHRIVTLKK